MSSRRATILILLSLERQSVARAFDAARRRATTRDDATASRRDGAVATARDRARVVSGDGDEIRGAATVRVWISARARGIARESGRATGRGARDRR